MDLTLTDEQQLLLDSARRFLGGRWDSARVRALEAADDGHDPDLWEQVRALGWPGLALPEEHGGAGRGMLELALLAEQLGRAAASSPLLHSTTSVALPLSWAAEGAPARRWLRSLADGRAVGALAHLEPGGAGDEWVRPAVELERLGGGFRLSGTKELVAFAEVADVLLVSVLLGPGDVGLVALERRRSGIEMRRQHTLGGDPLYRVTFDVELGEEDVVAGGTDGEVLVRRALERATVAACAYAAGLAGRALELSVRHARDRRQFDRPIGAFQAVAHRCADMQADVDAVRLLSLQAAWALDHLGDPGLEVAAAKAYANEAVRRVFVNAHQVHGALGFSLEHDLQLFTRRAKAFELSLGSVDRHRERVAQAMGL